MMNARQIREARNWAGYSQRELAGLLGVHPDTVANWETGRTRAPYRLRWHLALLLGEPLPGGFWDGWILRGDTLWSPANQGFKATELSYLWLTFEMARLWKAQNSPQVVAALDPVEDTTLPCQTDSGRILARLIERARHRGSVGAPGSAASAAGRGEPNEPANLGTSQNGGVERPDWENGILRKTST